MRMTAICFVVLSLACTLPPEPPHRRLILFEDITMSMASDEAAAVQKSVNDFIDQAPAGTEVIVVPICENTEGAPRQRWIMPFPKGASQKAIADAQKERKDIEAAVAKFMSDIRDQTTAARREYSSCISPGLRLVTNVMRAPGSNAKWITDVVFVSDMIEECRTSLLGQPVRLKIHDDQFVEASKLLSGERALLAVPPMHVFVILPKALSTASRKPECPAPAELQIFWQRLFERSGIPASQISWDADVAQYIGSTQRHS